MKRSSLGLIFAVILISVLGVFFLHPMYLGDKVRPWRLGLDLVGGAHLVYEVDMKQVAEADRETVMNGLRDVIERRVNLFGVSEPQVISSRSGERYRLIVELAGIKDISSAIKQIGETPFLVFAEEGTGTRPVQVTVGDKVINQEIDLSNQFLATKLTGRYVTGAQIAFDNTGGFRPVISLSFDETGSQLFEELTGRNVGKRIAVYLDKEIITAPVVNEKISGGQAQITGQFSIEEAKAIVERFNAGALPAPITLISQQTIGASLGSGSLTTTMFAGAIGTLAVILFMMLYYRKLGLLASIALIIYTIILLSIFKLFGITMTLAGIAGIILSIGMAVDANVLIFERTKEEMKKGMSKAAAIAEGFHRAWPSIRDSNIATMITSLILYTFTSSFIKGFALSLLLGVVVSMFTAITVTRTLVQVFSKEKTIA